MRKLLSILGAAGLVATTSATVVSCEKKDNNDSVEISKDQAIKSLKEEISKSQEILDKKLNIVGLKNDLRSDIRKANNLLRSKDATVEMLQVGQKLLEWKTNKIVLQDELGCESHEPAIEKSGKYELTRMISYGYEKLSDSLSSGLEENSLKSSLLDSLEKAIGNVQGDKKEEDYRVDSKSLETDINNFINEQTKLEEALRKEIANVESKLDETLSKLNNKLVIFMPGDLKETNTFENLLNNFIIKELNTEGYELPKNYSFSSDKLPDSKLITDKGLHTDEDVTLLVKRNDKTVSEKQKVRLIFSGIDDNIKDPDAK